jgi:hypothetical protein
MDDNRTVTSRARIFSQHSRLLEDLPTELWIEVTADLEPRDVLSLSFVRS